MNGRVKSDHLLLQLHQAWKRDPKIHTQKEFIVEMKKLLSEPKYFQKERMLIKKMFFNDETYNASLKIFKLIKDKIYNKI